MPSLPTLRFLTFSPQRYRIRLIEEYAETALDDQGLWRLAVDYLSYCGTAARRRMRFIILDVPLTGPDVQPSRTEVKRAEHLEAEEQDAQMDEEAEDPEHASEERQQQKQAEREAKKVADEYNVAMEIIQTCVELGMTQEARAVCKRMATEMAKVGRVGPALAYCVRAQDVRQMKRIVHRILRLYIEDSADAFCKAVDSIPSSLLEKASVRAASHAVGEESTTVMDMAFEGDKRADPLAQMAAEGQSAIYSSGLVFLARYRDFHRLCSQGAVRPAAVLLVELLTSNIAPEPFRAVLLVDAIPFLQGERDGYAAEYACLRSFVVLYSF